MDWLLKNKKTMKAQKQTKTFRLSADGASHILDMRIALLGNRCAGKSSSGNTILGKEEFGSSGRTAECVQREGTSSGRHITLVEAPGWWANSTVEHTSECDKREIALSVSPGLHALLLVIRLDGPFTETDRRSVQGHLELLGESVWNHTIVLFTFGDRFGDTSIEQHIRRGGAGLQWVVKTCGNRYHVLDNKKSDGSQVTELLEKVEEMVAGNSGNLFQGDQIQFQTLFEKKKEEHRRAEERKMEVQKLRESLKLSTGGVAHISDVRIVLLGNRYAGRSSSGNTILGRKMFETPGRTTECVKREGETAGRHITVVEAPGWWENSTIKETPVCDKREIVLSVSLCPPGPHALLLVIRVDVPFTGKCRKAMQEHMELLGKRVWSYTIVLFTRGDHLGDTSIEQHIEMEGEALQWVVEKCGNRYHVMDNRKSDVGQIVELLVKIEEMVAGNGGSLYETPRKQAHSQSQHPKMSDSGIASQDFETESSSSATRCTQSQGDLAKVSDSGFASQDFKTVSSSSQGDFAKGFISKIPFVSEDTIQIKEFIDGGSFGSVYQGSYQGTPVAVKMMPIGKCPSKSLELVIPLRLFHPNIVKMMAVSRKEHDILIAYEYIHGGNLQQIIHAQHPIKLNEEDKMCLALEIGMAVQYIHERNIIHQDIKPANILVSERSKTAYLTDWGLANMKDSLAQFGVSASGSMCGPRSAGTPLYMPPELLLHNERCTTMSDMWSLGLTCLEMFTGSEPWSLNNPYALPGLLLKQERPHGLAKLQPHLTEIVEPLIRYKPQSRMDATTLVTCLKSKVDLVKRYGFSF